MIVARLSKSKYDNKKFAVAVSDGRRTKTIRFGDRRYQDYTMHKNPARKLAYQARHFKRENWKDPFTAGFWSRWLLWNKPSLDQSIKDIQKRFKIKIIL